MSMIMLSSGFVRYDKPEGVPCTAWSDAELKVDHAHHAVAHAHEDMFQIEAPAARELL